MAAVPNYKNFIYMQDRGFIFAYVPKVACTNWKSLLRYMAGHEDWLDNKLAHDKVNGGLRYLDLTGPDAELLSRPDIRKYTMVRDPYSRVLSAYMNKVEQRLPVKPEGEGDHFDKIVRDIDVFRRDELGEESHPEITFEVFLLWLRDTGSWFTKDEHWAPQVTLLRQPEVKFDIVGRLEDLDEDAPRILEAMGCDRGFPSQQDVNFAPTDAREKIEKYVSESAQHLIEELFSEDLECFAYPFFRKKDDAPARSKPTDSDVINGLIEKAYFETGGGDVYLEARTYHIDRPIVIKTGVRLHGQGAYATRLKATKKLRGPVIISDNAEKLEGLWAWFEAEGMTVRFRVSDLCVDGSDASYGGEYGSGCGIVLYAKAFEIKDVQVINCKRHGIVSTGPARGGQKTWLDEPEAVFDVRISRCKGDGFIMRGPHDTIIQQAIIAECLGRGLAVETNGVYNGACDIEFCHAYATGGVAIDLAAKVKAGFLQGDTGRGSGVRIAGSDKTYVDRIECFKTRGSKDDFALDIRAPFVQIGLARVRADWGASGVLVAGNDVQIGQLDIDGKRNTGGPLEGTSNYGTGLRIKGHFAQIATANIRNFGSGIGVHIDEKNRGLSLNGASLNCDNHLIATDLNGGRIDFTIRRKKTETYKVAPAKHDLITIREF